MNEQNSHVRSDASDAEKDLSDSPHRKSLPRRVQPFVCALSLVYSAASIILSILTLNIPIIRPSLSSSLFEGIPNLGHIVLIGLLLSILIGSLSLVIKRESLTLLLAFGWFMLSINLVIGHFYWLPRLSLLLDFALSFRASFFGTAMGISIKAIPISCALLTFVFAHIEGNAENLNEQLEA
jgi:hypothetical protein